MRRLMWFALGFGAASALCAYLLPQGALPMLAIAGLVLGLAVGWLGRRRFSVRALSLALLGCGVGFCWYLGYYSLYANYAVSMDGQEQNVSIRTTDYSYETSYGIGVDGILTICGKPYQVRTYLDPMDPIQPGTELTGLFRFRVTTPEGEHESTYHPGKGIFLLAYQEGDIFVTERFDHTFRERAAMLRRGIEEILENTLPENTVPFAKALLLGNTTELDYKTDAALKVSGIRHVVAVSGLHISILFALLTAVTFRKRWLTVLLGFPMLAVFAAVAGFTPSVTRACIMSGLMLLALLTDRDYDRMTALAFAALVMLVCNPLVITSVSFQLSVASVTGICLFDTRIRLRIVGMLNLPKERNLRKTLVVWFSSAVSVTLSAMTLTVPLCALHFGVISLVSVLTNLLALWVVSFVFYGLIALCLLFLLWKTGAVLLGKLAAMPIRYVLFVSGWMAKFPLAAVYTRSVYILLWLMFVYLLLGIFLLKKDKQPWVLLCCGGIGLSLALIASWTEPMADDMRMTVLDVGQGQCILLQGDGRTYMVDCGGDSDTGVADIAAETLLSQGIFRLDGLILTHFDRDHAGAAENLLSRIPADLLILPPEYTGWALPEEKVLYADRDVDLSWGETNLRVLCAEYPGNSNEKSLCILFDTENCDILITGDRSGFGERMLLRYHQIPDVDVLVAGHHGAKSSACEQLLEAVRPEIVCISAGEENVFGHPHPELLERLSAYGCTIYRTDQNGEIIIRR